MVALFCFIFQIKKHSQSEDYGVFFVLWRRRESNPRPNEQPTRFLHA